MFRSSDAQAHVARFAERDVKHTVVYGPWRSGKSAVCIRAFLLWAWTRPSGCIYGMFAKSQAQLDTVIRTETEAFLADTGIKANLRTRPWEMQTSDGGTSQILVAVFGQGDGSATRLQGLTLMGSYADEATNMQESLRQMIVSRLSPKGARGVWTLNPDDEAHPFKRFFIDKIASGDVSGEVLKLGTMDNPSLGQDYYDELAAMLPFEWQRKRYIEGEWSSASGLVYPRAALAHPEGRVRDVPEPFTPGVLTAGVDWASKSVTHAVLAAWYQDAAWIVDEWRWDAQEFGQLDEDEQASRIAAQFLEWGSVRWWSVDQTSGGLIHALAQLVEGDVYPSSLPVSEGVNRVGRMFASDKLWITPRCVGLIEELRGYRWPDADPGKARPATVKPVKQNDHGIDALRYWCERVILPDPRPRRHRMSGSPGARRA